MGTTNLNNSWKNYNYKENIKQAETELEMMKNTMNN